MSNPHPSLPPDAVVSPNGVWIPFPLAVQLFAAYNQLRTTPPLPHPPQSPPQKMDGGPPPSLASLTLTPSSKVFIPRGVAGRSPSAPPPPVKKEPTSEQPSGSPGGDGRP